eukprot:766728-Hanusia_phi.AAC.3
MSAARFRSIASVAFSDPVCGDGKCEAPDEYPGFGRFGCVKDCGKYKNTSTLVINLEDIVQKSSAELGINLKGTLLETDANRPRFLYNIFSLTMGDFLFETDVNKSSMTVEVPDGDLILYLYQDRSSESTTEDLALSYRMNLNPR